MEYAKGVKGEIDQRPKRFYHDVSIEPVANGWQVLLDGRMLRTPERKPLTLPTRLLAQVIADEWSAQKERIDLQTMFNTRLANVVIDRAPAARNELAAEVAKYAETDLVCYLAEAPTSLRERQEAAWAPLRDWAGEFGAPLYPVSGIVPLPQPRASLDALLRHAESLDDFRLTGLVHAVGLSGSAVLGLAVEQGRLTASEAFELSRIDEAYQSARWGEDIEAAKRAESHRAEARALDRWFQSLAD
jgi:chaperone required for assembly of F1-ATPase